eukprot:scaffold14594_cov127-Isochrysis_galbana.AAC.4
MANRAQLDAASPNSFWITAAEKFNDHTFEPELFLGHDPDAREGLDLDSLGWTCPMRSTPSTRACRPTPRSARTSSMRSNPKCPSLTYLGQQPTSSGSRAWGTARRRRGRHSRSTAWHTPKPARPHKSCAGGGTHL